MEIPILIWNTGLKSQEVLKTEIEFKSLGKLELMKEDFDDMEEQHVEITDKEKIKISLKCITG